MILILLSWIYIVFTTTNLGFILNKALKTKVNDFAVLSILGLFLVTITASTWAIFGRINWEFHTTLLLLNLLIIIKFKSEVSEVYNNFFNDIKQLSANLKIILAAIAVLIIAQCSAIPYGIDNETYYIQTIKWLNEYGLVKGLGNLHPYFSQTSGWHIAQSAFSFSFLYPNFNDLSGFCLLLGNLFAILKVNEYFKNDNQNYLIIGLLSLANVFLFQFISAPSSDIPVYVISFIIFFYFLDRYKTIDNETFKLLTLLVIFCLYIKLTSIVLLAIPLLLLLKNHRLLFTGLLRLTAISIIVLVLFLVKNFIISGHPLFPVISNSIYHADYSIPIQLSQVYYEQTKTYSFFVTPLEYGNMPIYKLFLRWLMLPKIDGLFNKLAVLLIVVSPIVIRKFYNKKALWVLYFVMCLQLVVLFFTSPQYRFFVNFILLFSILPLAILIKNNKNVIITILYFSIFITAFAVLVPIDLNQFSGKKFTLARSNFKLENIVFPHDISQFDFEFEQIREGNLLYYSPIGNKYFYVTGNGPLPCINQKLIETGKKKYGIVPQLRGNNPGDGFYPAPVARD
ncbi:hypothetical protein FMM05_06220 [Flavobacterium zepuense]|uniref:DUF8201 domain-containing protein n=1 Tax=Flavobacterium zepuense TaxID=2593302 RepID=A0A552V5Q8_9FLAO|nr:hypothetical protein [Flavobacterium zepuense]TRW25815.1 hypothetical protein FMM05_06220 [Flavobacterium zepuense]